MPWAKCERCKRTFHMNLTEDGQRIWNKNYKSTELPEVPYGPCCYKEWNKEQQKEKKTK